MRFLNPLSTLPAGVLTVALAAWPNAGAQPQAPGVPTRHVAASGPSGLAHFKGYRPAEPTDWRAANARVAEIGGWRAYAREQHEAKSAESKPGQPASAPGAPMGHRP